MYWYEDEVKRLEKTINALSYSPEIVFYGSSSFRMWEHMNEDLSDFSPLNLGFGGSTLAGCVWFFERVFSKLSPQGIVLYAGDNDLGDGRHPEEVYIFFQRFVTLAEQHFGSIPCFFVSLKPSISRWNMVDKFRYTNKLIAQSIEQDYPNWQFINIFDKMLSADGRLVKENYSQDGLHMNRNGYAIWTKEIKQHLSSVIKAS